MSQTQVLEMLDLPPSERGALAPTTCAEPQNDLVWIDPERMSGTPCFAGTRVPIKHLWDYLEAGEPLDEFLEGFPGVTREQAVGVLEMAFREFSVEGTKPDPMAPSLP